MRDEEAPELHNPVVHEVSLASWLVHQCLQHEHCWSNSAMRGHILLSCGQAVECVGELVDRITDQDQEMAAAVRHLSVLLTRRGQEMEATGE
jgi:hypothetical protein